MGVFWATLAKTLVYDFMNDITTQQYTAFCDFVDTHDAFLIAGHKEPDGDCIASCIGVAAILQKKLKPYKLLSSGPFKRPEIKAYYKRFSSTLPFMTQDERKATGLILADCAEVSRLGDIEGDFCDMDIFIIDHHKTSEKTTISKNSNAIIDPTCPAASLLVYSLYEKLIGTPDLNLANTFFLGLATDTGYFRFLGSDSAKVFSAASRLVGCGVNPKKIYSLITGGRSFASRKLLGVLLSKAELYLNGKLIVTYETQEDSANFALEGRDSDALYSALLATQGVQVALFVRQEEKNTCTAGLRSKDSVDVSLVAAKFGGGGHKNAAGLSTEGDIKTLIPTIVKELAKVM